MSEGLTVDLVKITVILALISFWICTRYLSPAVAATITTIKFLLPLTYFAYDSRAIEGLNSDDVYYLKSAQTVLESGYDPITALIDPKGFQQLFLVSGEHFLYNWFNILAQYLFGKYYYSPVLLNVLITFISGLFFYKLIKLFGFGNQYAKLISILFLIHWDTIAWSSFVNLKDPLLSCFTIIVLYLLLKLSKGYRFSYLCLLVLTVIPFLALRLYAPILIFFAYILWNITNFKQTKRKYIIIGSSLAILTGYLFFLGLRIHYLQKLSFGNLLYGIIRFWLNPVPWQIKSEYHFLVLPSTLHWLFFLPTIIGGWLLWKRSKEFRMILFYVFISTLLYAAFTAHQGVRYRIPLTPAIIMMQFHFLWVMLYPKFHKKKYSSIIADINW